MVDFKKGLTFKEVEESKKKFGTNALAEQETDTLWQMFIGAFDDIWIKVLCGALVVKIVLAIIGVIWPEMSSGDDVIEIFSIIMAILLATGFSTLSEYQNTTRSNALHEEYSKTYSKVIRDGKLIEILTNDIVKGDIILIQAGDKVPTDGLIRHGKIKVSQAALNGESRDETKTFTLEDDKAEISDYSDENKVFMGSVVTSGEAYMEATVIGDNSELGKINASLTQDEDTPQDATSLKLEKVAASIGKLGVAGAVAAAVMTVIFTLIGNAQTMTAVHYVQLGANVLMLIASIIIMAVPEGLPLMTSLVQAMVSKDLYEKHILVSHKDAFSDSAYLDILFSDKTGTITKGMLSLTEHILGNGEITKELDNKEFINSITLNNLAKVSADNKATGSNNMDRALLDYAIGKGYVESQELFDTVKEVNGFDSEKKCATVVMKDNSTYWKGATEIILDKITHYMLPNGEIVPFTEKNKVKIKEVMHEQTKRSMKLLTVAKIVANKTILYSILCLRDDVRPDSIETVKILKEAGIQTTMVTGDNGETAVAIAKEAGIFEENSTDIALTHDELEQLTDDELKEKIPYLKVVSRAKPMDKKRLVKLSQELDHVVGMTGDGINDSPALKQASVGFAMGSGTAVAQQAGDIVVLDDSLKSICNAILASRTMSKSIGKFLIFQLVVNIACIGVCCLGPIFNWGNPFSIVSILYINLIMDTLCALAFGASPMLERYMKEKPVKRTAPILTPYIKTSIGVCAIFIILGCVLILENAFGIVDLVAPAGYKVTIGAGEYTKSFMFAFFVFSVIFNGLNVNSETLNIFEHLKENKNFVIVFSGIFISEMLILMFAGPVFGTVPLTLEGYLLAMGMAMLIIPVDMVKKIVLKKLKK